VTSIAAHRWAGLLRYAAIQFVVLTGCAMVLYRGGTWYDPTAAHYELAHNFFSDLGRTRGFTGAPNYASAALFGLALASVGAALVGFAWTWRGFAFARERARGLGHASAIIGTTCGLALVGVACSPFDLALRAHNLLVIAAFGQLMIYVALLTIVMWRNGIAGTRLAVNLGYLALVTAYFGLVLFGPSLGTPRGHTIQVVGQKLVVYSSMLQVLYLAATTRSARSGTSPP
jgi:hypothetical membrane protein